jgi:hypothetical protein
MLPKRRDVGLWGPMSVGCGAVAAQLAMNPGDVDGRCCAMMLMGDAVLLVSRESSCQDERGSTRSTGDEEAGSGVLSQQLRVLDRGSRLPTVP